MKNLLKRVMSLALCLMLVLTFAACHKPGETALTVDGEAFTSGFYACAFLAAYNEAQNRVYEEATEKGENVTSLNYLQQTIDGKTYSDWVKSRAIDICKQMMAAKKLCEQNNVSTADYLESAKENAKTQWNSSREYFEKNGIGLQSYQTFCAYEQYATAYFDYLYGKEGPKEVTEDTLKEYVKENYFYVNAIDVDVTKMTEAQLADQEKEYNKLIDRVKAGESFGKIYAEAMGTTYSQSDDVTEANGFSYTSGMIWGAEGTAYENVLFKDVKDMKENTFKIITNDTAVEGYKYMLLIFKGDIFGEKNPNLEAIKSTALTDMKGDELSELLVNEAKNITATENTKATKQFKVDKVYYPESTTY